MSPFVVFTIGLFLGLILAAGLIAVLSTSRFEREEELERALIGVLRAAESPDAGTVARVRQLVREVLP